CDGNCSGKFCDCIELPFRFDPVEEPIDEGHDAGPHVLEDVWGQSADDGSPDARVIRGIVEYEARRVMFVQCRAITELWRKRRLLVGAERAPVTIDTIEI